MRGRREQRAPGGGQAPSPTAYLRHSIRLRYFLWPVMQDEQLVCFRGQLGVGAAFVINELDFVSAIKELHYSADLTAHETMLRQVGEQRYNSV